MCVLCCHSRFCVLAMWRLHVYRGQVGERRATSGEDGRGRGDSGVSGGVGMGADGGDLAGAADGAAGGGECSVEA